ncbi:hypothetical protein ACSVIJ_05345 [Pseudomonas sp. NCHU5208]|uniref:hypothetical protein n=1 Tax=unclassified Pseudomonas TaxID=196821 RepID=UPI003F98665C
MAHEASTTCSDPIIAACVGATVAYGPLFAYLFRRFGYPNAGWDDYKEMAKYILTTPHPGMMLQIVPHAGDWSSMVFTFLVQDEVADAILEHDKRDQEAWKSRAYDWAESQGIPDWMDDWIKIYSQELRQVFGTHADEADWREAIKFCLPMGSEGDPSYSISRKAWSFKEGMFKGYGKIETRPEDVKRSVQPQEWADDDPLKPLADAAMIALKDLLRPVRVRDAAINLAGPVEHPRNAAKEAPVSGYPSGDLGNAAPADFAQLHQLILQLGKGNARKGIAKATSLLRASVRLN